MLEERIAEEKWNRVDPWGSRSIVSARLLRLSSFDFQLRGRGSRETWRTLFFHHGQQTRSPPWLLAHNDRRRLYGVYAVVCLTIQALASQLSSSFPSATSSVFFYLISTRNSPRCLSFDALFFLPLFICPSSLHLLHLWRSPAMRIPRVNNREFFLNHEILWVKTEKGNWIFFLENGIRTNEDYPFPRCKFSILNPQRGGMEHPVYSSVFTEKGCLVGVCTQGFKKEGGGEWLRVRISPFFTLAQLSWSLISRVQKHVRVYFSWKREASSAGYIVTHR